MQHAGHEIFKVTEMWIHTRMDIKGNIFIPSIRMCMQLDLQVTWQLDVVGYVVVEFFRILIKFISRFARRVALKNET